MDAHGDYVKNKSTASGNNYLNDYDKLIFGNDAANKEALSTFSITKASDYPIMVAETGYSVLCLPFNVILPEGVVAYDLELTDIQETDKDGLYAGNLKAIAQQGEILKSGTPVITKASAGVHNLEIASSAGNAVTSLSGLLLRGNLLSQSMTPNTEIKKYLLSAGTDGSGFYVMEEGSKLEANQAYLEWIGTQGEEAPTAIVFEYKADDDTGVNDIITSDTTSREIYNLGGQRMNKTHKGVNIISGKKVIMK